MNCDFCGAETKFYGIFDVDGKKVVKHYCYECRKGPAKGVLSLCKHCIHLDKNMPTNERRCPHNKPEHEFEHWCGCVNDFPNISCGWCEKFKMKSP